MLKKLLFTLALINFIALPFNIQAGRGSGAGFALGFLGGALMTNAAYNNMGYGVNYGYYPQAAYPYVYAPQYNYYGNPGYPY